MDRDHARGCEGPDFRPGGGPLVDGDRIALRCYASGRYSGGFPGATAAPGTAIAFTGTDLLRIEDGRIAEYWVNSDMHGQLTVRTA